MTLEIRAEGSKACLKVRLGRFQNDPTMILAKRRRKFFRISFRPSSSALDESFPPFSIRSKVVLSRPSMSFAPPSF
jgi:hypothetical protein